MGLNVGYDSEMILMKVRDSLLKVKKGEAAYERDSVLFDKVEYSWPLLAGLMWVAAQNKGALNVVDFGGSLGTTYFQNRCFLKGLYSLTWNIVEQPRFVDCGRTMFADNRLHFYTSIEQCLAENEAQVLIASGVIQYLEDPYFWMKTVVASNFEYIIIDRTPLDSTAETDRRVVQRVPPEIYNAMIPCWLLSEKRIRLAVESRYNLVSEFPGFQEGKGFIYRIKQELK